MAKQAPVQYIKYLGIQVEGTEDTLVIGDFYRLGEATGEGVSALHFDPLTGEVLPDITGDTLFAGEYEDVNAEDLAEILAKQTPKEVVKKTTTKKAATKKAASKKAAAKKEAEKEVPVEEVTEKDAPEEIEVAQEEIAPETEVAKEVPTEEVKVVETEELDIATAIMEGEATEAIKEGLNDISVTGEGLSDIQLVIRGNDALNGVKELIKRNNQTEYAIGGVMSHIRSTNLYLTLGEKYEGNNGFKLYIEDELDIRPRKADYLIKTFDYFSELGIDENRLHAMGWTKAKELVGIAVEDFDRLANFADNHTVKELQEHLKTGTLQVTDGTSMETAKYTLNFKGSACETIKRALAEVKKYSGNDHVGDGFEYICMDWLQLSVEGETTLETELRLLEAKYNVNLVEVRDEATNAEAEEQLDIEDAIKDSLNQGA